MNEDKERKEPEYVPRFFLYPFSFILSPLFGSFSLTAYVLRITFCTFCLKPFVAELVPTGR